MDHFLLAEDDFLAGNFPMPPKLLLLIEHMLFGIVGIWMGCLVGDWLSLSVSIFPLDHVLQTGEGL
jgi:hypothetical protein